jgi:hypothetical protein
MSSEAAERLVAGRWTLETALRRGPSGVIWRAAEVIGGRRLAVEQLRLPASPDPADPGQSALWDRVAAETRAAASLGHPGLVALDDVVVEDGVVYVASELVEAALTLDELVARHGPLPVRRVAQLGLELLDALEAAHGAGLVHLDLRPGNVLVAADGRARLAGVGLATLRRDLGAGSAGASRSYLAPEQVRGDPAGPPADLWSLGAVMWLAVEGESPFAGDRSDATATAILADPPPPAALAGPLTPALHALLTKPPGGRPGIPEARRLLEPVAGASHPQADASQPRRAMAAPPEGERSWWGTRLPEPVHTPLSWARAARNAIDPTVQRVLLIAGGSVLLALLAFVVAVAVNGDPLGLRSQAVASTVAAVAPTAVPPTTAPPTTVPPPTTAAAVVPPGWLVHIDPVTRYQIAVPPGWQIGSEGQRTELRDQSSPTFPAHRLAAGPSGRPADPRAAGRPGPRRRARRLQPGPPGALPVQGPPRRPARVHLPGRRDLACPGARRPLPAPPRRHGHLRPRPRLGRRLGPVRGLQGLLCPTRQLTGCTGGRRVV